MNKNEKTLLLELLLRDTRGNWGWHNDGFNRTVKALELAKDLSLKEHISRIKSYIEQEENDGRFFRTSYKDGGYEGMYSLHELDSTLKGKSEEFIKLCMNYLTYPESLLDDYEE